MNQMNGDKMSKIKYQCVNCGNIFLVDSDFCRIIYCEMCGCSYLDYFGEVK